MTRSGKASHWRWLRDAETSDEIALLRAHEATGSFISSTWTFAAVLEKTGQRSTPLQFADTIEIVPDITDLLNRWSGGDRHAFEEMIPLVYGDLKRVAQRALQNEQHARTFDCTVLVHEAYLRLVDQERMQWNGRAHFFGAAAQVMRRILVEHARRRLAGSGASQETLDKIVAVAQEPDLDVIALNDALDELAAGDPESAQVVELRCFGGLSIEETAEVMNTSPSSVTRSWTFARAWLYRRLTST